METIVWIAFVAGLVVAGLVLGFKKRSVWLGASLVVIGTVITAFMLWAPDSFRGETIQATPPSEALFPDAQPGSDWTLAVAPGWPNQPGFSLMLPPGWTLNELQGIDSYVGEITGDGVRLMFDYGRYGWNLTPEDEPEHEYIVSFEDIGGREAKLLLAVDSPSNSTTATYEAATGVHFGGLDSNHNLMLEGRGLTREQQRVAIAIFRSIRLPE